MAVAVSTGVGESAAIPAPLTVTEAAALAADDVLARLGSGVQGLAAGEAARRLQVAGPNAVRSYRARALPVLWSQLRSRPRAEERNNAYPTGRSVRLAPQ